MTRTRDRKSAEGLLPRMEAIVGKKATLYRYHPAAKGSKPISLGHDRLDALRQVLDLLGESPDRGTVKWVWEKYQESKRWKRLAQATKDDYTQCSVPILACFGHRQIGRIDSTMLARYMREYRADAVVRANREKSLFSNLFYCGIDHGVCRENPAKSVQPNIEEPRTEAPDTAVLAKFLAWVNQQTPQRRIIGLAAQFCSLAGSRKIEFLDLAWPQVDEAAGKIRIKRAKQRGKKRGEVIEEIEIRPALQACLDELKTIRPSRECLYVFPTRDNNAYNQSGFKTLWSRVVHAAIAAKVITTEDRFTFHDLRAFYATEHKAVTGKLPDLHKNPETTARVYDRNKVVKRSSN